MKVLSFRQPWLYAVLHLGKGLDNRPRGMSYRGELLMHASLGANRSEYEEAQERLNDACRVRAPASETMLRGGICGVCRVVDCLEPDSLLLRGQSWYMPVRDGKRQFGVIVERAAPLPFTSLKGQLGLFEYEPKGELLAAINAWRAARAA